MARVTTVHGNGLCWWCRRSHEWIDTRCRACGVYVCETHAPGGLCPPCRQPAQEA